MIESEIRSVRRLRLHVHMILSSCGSAPDTIGSHVRRHSTFEHHTTTRNPFRPGRICTGSVSSGCHLASSYRLSCGLYCSKGGWRGQVTITPLLPSTVILDRNSPNQS